MKVLSVESLSGKCDDRAFGRLPKVMARWQLVNAWPVKHCVPGFNAESNENAIENMELAHEGLEREF